MTTRTFLFAIFLCLLTVGIIATHPLSSSAAKSSESSQIFLPSMANDFCGPYFDPFDDPDTGWITGPVGELHAEVREGEYGLMFTGRGMVWLVPGPVCEHTAYRAAVDVRWINTTGNFAGLLFNLDDSTRNGYLFAINTDDRVWLVFEVDGNSLTTKISPVGNDAILPGTAVNRLSVERANQSMILSVNGMPVGELHDDQPGRPVIAGVAAASYTTQDQAEVRFDNFTYDPIAPAQ